MLPQLLMLLLLLGALSAAAHNLRPGEPKIYIQTRQAFVSRSDSVRFQRLVGLLDKLGAVRTAKWIEVNATAPGAPFEYCPQLQLGGAVVLGTSTELQPELWQLCDVVSGFFFPSVNATGQRWCRGDAFVHRGAGSADRWLAVSEYPLKLRRLPTEDRGFSLSAAAARLFDIDPATELFCVATRLWFTAGAIRLRAQFVGTQLPEAELNSDRLGIAFHEEPPCSVLSMQRQLLGEGFHREIRTTIGFAPKCALDMRDGFTSVQLTEQLPTGIYVDPFELQNLAQLRPADYFVRARVRPHSVNLESPASQSPQMRVKLLQHCHGAQQCVFSMPLHVRYQPPAVGADDPGYIRVQLHSPIEVALVNVAQRARRPLPYACDNTVITIAVPRGRLGAHDALVTAVTLAVALAGAGYLFFVLRKPRPRPMAAVDAQQQQQPAAKKGKNRGRRK